MNARDRLSLNRVAKPQLPLVEFLELAARLGFRHVEVRNDFTERGVLDGLSEAELGRALDRTGVEIVSINALYPFEDGRRLADSVARLRALAADARRARCARIVLCPLNEAGDPRSAGERADDLVRALDAYGPILEDAGLLGLVEALGFERSALRSKRAALDGIARSRFPRSYRLLHDTFHHWLAEERELFPAETGLVHVSGVLAGKPRPAIGDDDRVLVDERDVMDTRGQVAALLGGGCDALVSYEPFSPAVRAMPVPALEEAIRRSVDFLLG
jgi:2-keto-myo-inositol isomerase